MYTAKRHAILQDLAKEMNGRHLEETVTADGHEFKVRTLTPAEDDWVLSRTEASGGDPVKLAVLQAKPKVAAALVAIDGIPIRDLFQTPEGMPESVSIAMDEKDWSEWRRDQVLEFMSNDMLPGAIARIWNTVMNLEQRRDVSAIAVKEQIKEDPSSGSEAMS